MRVLVTGAGGMLGSDVVRAAEFANHETVRLTRAELDVTDAAAVRAALERELPDAVINCAGHTDLDAAQEDLRRAMEANAEGAANVAEAAAAIGAAVVYPSTGYVFDGAKAEPYVESDEPRPLSVHAQSKLAGERATAAANPRHFVARSTWLFGVRGRNFVETMLALGSDHGEVVVARDQVACPTYSGHFADVLVQLLDTTVYGVHHLAGEGACSWYEFALGVFEQSEIDCRVLSYSVDEFTPGAPLPRYAVLETERESAFYLPHWRDGLASYLAERVPAR